MSFGTLTSLFKDREAVIGIIGLGYVGLPQVGEDIFLAFSPERLEIGKLSPGAGPWRPLHPYRSVLFDPESPCLCSMPEYVMDKINTGLNAYKKSTHGALA